MLEPRERGPDNPLPLLIVRLPISRAPLATLSQFAATQSPFNKTIGNDLSQSKNLPEQPGSDGPDTKRFRYGDASKLSVVQFKGFTCDDVSKWVNVYVKKCWALNINKARSFISTVTNLLISALSMTLHS